MNKRTGVCQHTKPLTYRDNVVEFVDFEEKQLLSGETVRHSRVFATPPLHATTRIRYQGGGPL